MSRKAALLPRCRGLLLAWVAMVGCGLQERSDYLIGRQCDPETPADCDEGQVCLPHQIADRTLMLVRFRCRDAASFESLAGQEPPLAYCDDEQYVCPAGLVCNADRIRVDGGLRPRVCKQPDDAFAPPLDAGPDW